jgi:hypothetical protein
LENNTNNHGLRISPDDFARIVIDRLRQTSETATVSYDREQFCLRGAADEVFNLHEVHQVYCETDDKSREKLLSGIAQTWFRQDFSLPEEFADAAHDLMPYVHSRVFFELAPLRWPYQVLGEFFGVTVVYEWHGYRQFISQEHLDAWGVSLDGALAIAKETLEKFPADVARPKSGEGLCWLATGDDRDSSRLLLPDIRQWKLNGDTIVMISNRDTLLISGSEDEKGLAQMVAMAMESASLRRSISGIALRLTGETWVPWLPGESHSQYRGFRRLQLRTLGQEYLAQHEVLAKRHQESEQDIRIEVFGIAELSDGRLVSSTEWLPGNEIMLPKTDVIVFARYDTQPVPVTWEGAASVVGNLMEPLDMYPPRFRVRAYPTAVQLAWMESEHHAE